jgi:hypothetical protein
MINAAYEFLIKNFSFMGSNDFSETEDELKVRIRAIKLSFEQIHQDYYNFHNSAFERMVNELVNTLNGYSSYGKLEKNINSDFLRIVDNGVGEILKWFNTRISKITISYDEWINGYLRSTYKNLMEEEFNNWYKSDYFYLYMLSSIVISEIIFLLIIYSSNSKFMMLLAVIPLILGPYLYNKNVKRKFSLRENIVRLNKDKFLMNPSTLFIKSDDGASIATSAIGLGSMGALIGLIGGPIGSIIGGVIGGILGGIFGESVDQLRQKLYDRLIPKLVEIEKIILDNLDEQFPKIEAQLINTIQDNYNKNKQSTVKLLLESNNKKLSLKNTFAEIKNNPTKRTRILSLASLIILTFIGILYFASVFNDVIIKTETDSWRDAKRINSEIAYQNFIAKYPSGDYHNEAANLIESLIWTRVRNNNSFDGYVEYMDKNQNGKYLSDCRKIVDSLRWSQVIRLNSINGYIEYIDKEQNGDYVSYARKRVDPLLWAQSKKTDCETGYLQYLKYCTNGNHVKDAEQKLESIRWIEIRNSKDLEKVNNFLSLYPYSTHNKELQQLSTILSFAKKDSLENGDNANENIQYNSRINEKLIRKYRIGNTTCIILFHGKYGRVFYGLNSECTMIEQDNNVPTIYLEFDKGEVVGQFQFDDYYNNGTFTANNTEKKFDFKIID